MTSQKSVDVKVGIFVLICLVIAAGLIIRFGKYGRLGADAYTITAVFNNVGGIVRDSSVLYAGIPVGRVREIHLDTTKELKVFLTLAIREGVKIRADSRFVIAQSGLLGDRFIDIVPGSPDAPSLEPGAVVTGESTADVNEALRSAVQLLSQFGQTLDRADKAVKRVTETVLSQETLDHAQSALVNLDAAATNAAVFTLRLQQIADENREAISLSLQKFSSAAENLQASAEEIRQMLAESRQPIQNAALRLDEILTKIEQGQGTVGKLVVDPSLHDELLQLIEGWRRHGIFYKAGGRPRRAVTVEGREERSTYPHPTELRRPREQKTE
jgi:phospholipid/cholesterol/gamma-HCH transport system substrate-binding protein